MKAIKFILLIMISTSALTLSAQDEIIKPSDSGLSFLDDTTVEHIRIVSSDTETLLIEVKCKTDEDKIFQFSGELLDATKMKLSAFSCAPQELSKGSETVDLAFTVSKKNTSSKAKLNSSYIRIKMIEKEEDDSLLGDLEELLGGGGSDPIGDMFSKKYTFKYEKDWRLKGNKSMVINVPLIPVGSAKALK
jgi:hypothetical protein